MITARGRRIALEAVAMLASTVLVMSLPSSLQATGPWSQPVALAPCSAPGSPAVLFPSDEPHHATGPGAIVWGAGAGCAGAAGTAGARVSAIVPGEDAPGPAAPARETDGRMLALSPQIAAQTAPHGRILVVGRSPAAGVGAQGLLLSEGSAEGPFITPQATGGGGPLALTSAYLGDVALVSPGGADAAAGGAHPIELRVHRYYARAFSPPVPVTPGPGAEGLALAMDYRSDALIVWERAGAIYARDMPGSGRSSRAAVRIASADPGAHISALLSDDNRAILAWSETSSGVTSVYAELSQTGPRFGPEAGASHPGKGSRSGPAPGAGTGVGAPRLLERFSDPGGHLPPDGDAPRLVRLSSESVMLAWSGATNGRWVVHTVAVDENGVRTIDTISKPGHAALLDDLTAGPLGEAYALWSEPRAMPAGGLAYHDQAIYAARGIDAYPGRTIFGPPQLIAPAGAGGTDGEAAVGVDPNSDRAIAAWRASGGAIDYSLRSVAGTGG